MPTKLSYVSVVGYCGLLLLLYFETILLCIPACSETVYQANLEVEMVFLH